MYLCEFGISYTITLDIAIDASTERAGSGNCIGAAFWTQGMEMLLVPGK